MTSVTVATSSSYRHRLPRTRPVLALVRRDYLLTRSYQNTFLLEFLLGVINMLVYFYISRTFEDTNPGELQGAASYFDFAVVGIIVTVVIGATSTEVASRVRQEQLTGTLEALFVQPLRAAEVALGLLGLPFLFAMLRATAYVGVAAMFLGLDVSNATWPGAAIMLATTGAALGSLGIAAGAIALVIKRGELVTGMILFAMGFVSGAVFPVTVLPDWLQRIGDIVPTRFAFDGLRSALFGTTDWQGDVLALGLFTGIFLPMAIWSFASALSWTKNQGSLSQY